MFTAVPQQPYSYSDPWNLPVEERIQRLTSRQRRVVYFYRRPDSSTFRYRVFNMVEALDSAPDLDTSAGWFGLDDFACADSFLDRADVVVICRSSYCDKVNTIIAKARVRKLPVIFDVDDFIFDTNYTHVVIETLDQKTDRDEVWDFWFGHMGRIGGTFRLCDRAIVTNAYLAEKTAAFASRMPRPSIVPNFMNRLQQTVSESLFHLKRASGFSRDHTICIGYFSGTPTHNRDFEIPAEALARVLEKYPDVVLRVVGFMEVPAALTPYQSRIQLYPLQNFVDLQRLIAEIEINIAPLQINEFTNCKSELKFFEAAAVGTLTVASPSFTFANAIDHGRTGLLAGGQQWDERIAEAIEIVRDVPRYREIADAAFESACSRYSWHRYADDIVASIFAADGQRQ